MNDKPNNNRSKNRSKSQGHSNRRRRRPRRNDFPDDPESLEVISPDQLEKSKKGMNLTDLKVKPPSELVELGESLGLENLARSRKQDVIFSILKAHAKNGEDIDQHDHHGHRQVNRRCSQADQIQHRNVDDSADREHPQKITAAYTHHFDARCSHRFFGHSFTPLFVV